MKKTYYVTTAIDYVNAEPHIGHAYQKIVADVLARWNKLKGKEVYYLTGTDEHGKKVAQAADAAGKSPKDFVDEVSKRFIKAWEMLNIGYDRFIKTTDKDHEKVVHDITKSINKKGDIYKGMYEGYYCTGCEAYYTETECPDLRCKIHDRPLEKLKEESYFFRLSKYQDFLLELYQENPGFVLPASRRNEVINRVKEGLNDLSMSRRKESLSWGIDFPLDEEHVFYVWFEALINYYTATRASEGLEKFWPADVHLLGKDNTWFHTVIWPAMLKSASLPLPKTTFNHGFLSFNGQKISKSLGNAISIPRLVETYGSESIRYFVLRQFPFASGEDGDFNEKALIQRHNDELADKLGNLVSRVSALSEKYGLKETKSTLDYKPLKEAVTKYMDSFEFDKALNRIFAFIDRSNEHVQEKRPWETKSPEVLYELSEAIRDISVMLWPFLPRTSESIANTFGFDLNIKSLDEPMRIKTIKKSPILFKKL